jgi:hypothetical protein
VNFKITLDCKHEGGHYFKVKFDWFDAKPPTTDGVAQVIETQANDTGFLKEWNLVQIEGEEPVDQAVADDPKAKGKAPPAKGKGAATGALEEITDNRPRIINFEKKFGAEAEGGQVIKITEDVAKYFEGFMMPITIW